MPARLATVAILMLACLPAHAGHANLRDYGVRIGVLQPGKWNAITDVPGVLVGQKSLVEGNDVRTGVTAILPYAGNIFQNKVPAAVYVGNGFGKLTGTTQIAELGNIETPIVLTNTLSVPTAAVTASRRCLSLEGIWPESRRLAAVRKSVTVINSTTRRSRRSSRPARELRVLAAC